MGCVWQQRFVCTDSKGGEVGREGMPALTVPCRNGFTCSLEISLATGKWHSHLREKALLVLSSLADPSKGNSATRHSLVPWHCPHTETTCEMENNCQLWG